jgi:predicted acylesterase/phospholipase RssA
MLDKYMTDQVMRAIAAERKKGRRLFIGTTNLDASRAVLWNIGAIAASGDPSALELIRKIMLASAAIPVAFPPVYFQVEYNGQTYDEMHVDGGAYMQALYDVGYNLAKNGYPWQKKPPYYATSDKNSASESK